MTLLAHARDIYVDPDFQVATDAATSTARVQKIRDAIRMALPGDTIHLAPKVYHDEAAFYDSHGEPGRPITLDGHGATLDGSDSLRPDEWQEVEPGLFRNDDLTPLTDAMIDRWFFLWGDKVNRMGRVSKATSPPLSAPSALQPGEWTFVKDETRQAPAGYIAGSFYIRLPAGQSLLEATIAAPIRSAGVLIAQSNSHLVIRNLTATHVYNDGYNISGTCSDIALENIRAINCGDDGISAHTDSQYDVNGFVSIGNATGICDTGVSQTTYRNVFIADCLAHDLFFIQSGRYSITNGVILSSARYAVTVDSLNEPGPCRLELNNVLIVRSRSGGCLSVAKDCALDAERVTLRNLDITLTGGKVNWNHSVVEGQVANEEDELAVRELGAAKTLKARKSRIEIGAAVEWRGENNRFAVESMRIGGQPALVPPEVHLSTAGFNRAMLSEIPIPVGYNLPD